jgi:alanine racemase
LVYELEHIAAVLQAKAVLQPAQSITHLLTDSRKVVFPETALFFALSGPRRSGHQFIAELYERNLRAFVVQELPDTAEFPKASFLVVPDVLAALQQLVASHRQQFRQPVMGITGSNGKTIVKEWLYQLMQADENIVRSPRSYNSQIGVPLSVWQLQPEHTLGIFEAGISAPGEMEKLERVIRPDFGIFTNLGDAHREGFESDRAKAIEKAKLFIHSKELVFCREALAPHLYPDTTDRGLFPAVNRFFSWSRHEEADLRIIAETVADHQTCITAIVAGVEARICIPFTDTISRNNAITCWAVLLLRGYSQELIEQRMLLLEPVDMRMQLKRGIHQCYILNDSYSNDSTSLELAIGYLQQQAGQAGTTLILSDMLQSGQPADTLYRHIARLLLAKGIRRLIGIGPVISSKASLFGEIVGAQMRLQFFDSTERFLQEASTQQFRDEYILLKGARVFAFERISQWLEQQVHQTVMEINLGALVHNLKTYQQALQPSTKLMAMVKAFSYGSGSAEIARVLQFHKVDYLAVAYADEGVELRKAGISLPIMVMNVDEAGFDAMVSYDLEPEIYSFPVFHRFHQYLKKQAIRQFPVHIKVNTGMNRLGFELTDMPALSGLLRAQGSMMVRSVLSHLAGSEDPSLDDFTRYQVRAFEQACTVLAEALGYPFLRHIDNSAGIFRHPANQMDMVRLGIGLYGVDSSGGHQQLLQTVATLKTTIAQIRKVAAGDTVGYNRRGVLHRDSVIATVRIGYADGYDRRLGNGVGQMYLHGQLAPVVGSVCMDMTMLDITDIPEAAEGDIVEVFGARVPIQDLAARTGTIAYELMTGVSQRVKRIYVEE